MSAATNKNSQRGHTIKLLRKIHGWLGLWGALLGLLFGISGFLLNHRAVMKIPAAKMELSEIQLAVPAPGPADAKTFALLLQKELQIGHEPVKPKGEHNSKPPREAMFMDKAVKLPETIKVEFQLPQARIQAEYIIGNQFATVKREDANLWGFLTRMHKAVGANTGWVLLADSLAGAMLILSITGVLLWTKMRGSRLVMVGMIGGSAILTIWASVAML